MKKLLLGLTLLALSTGLWCSDVVLGGDDYVPNSDVENIGNPSLLYKAFASDQTGLISSDLSATTIINDVVVDSDSNHIYVCGSLGSTALMMVARYRKEAKGNYALDTNWGTNGCVTITFDASTASVANAMHYKDGENVIYLTGQATVSGTLGFVVAAINKSDGSLVTAFDTDGKKAVGTFSSGSGQGYDIIGDGTHLYACGVDDSGNNFLVAKMLKSDGSLVTDFDADGLVTVNPGSGGTARAIVKDGSALYVAGDGSSKFALVKLHSDNGKLYTTANGYTAFSTDVIINATTGIARAVAVDDTYVYVAGDNASNIPTIIRYKKSDGADDTSTTFGTSGVATPGGSSHPTSMGTEIHDMKIQGDHLYVSGTNDTDFVVSRVLKNGILDTSWHGNGIRVITETFLGVTARALTFLSLPGSPIVLAGYRSGSFIDLAAVQNNY